MAEREDLKKKSLHGSATAFDMAIVSLGLTLLIAAYALHRQSGFDDVLPRYRSPRKARR